MLLISDRVIIGAVPPERTRHVPDLHEPPECPVHVGASALAFLAGDTRALAHQRMTLCVTVAMCVWTYGDVMVELRERAGGRHGIRCCWLRGPVAAALLPHEPGDCTSIAERAALPREFWRFWRAPPRHPHATFASASIARSSAAEELLLNAPRITPTL